MNDHFNTSQDDQTVLNERALPTINMLGAAILSAAAGWWVLPCREQDCGESGAKAPYLRHGFKDASNDPQMIVSWWTRWPTALIGGCVPNGLLVFDIDPRNGGSYRALMDALGPLPATLTAWSGRGDGGRHLYFRCPAGALTSRALPAGVDLKKSGYLILPPSLHPATGLPYAWDLRDPVELPALAIMRLQPTVVPRITKWRLGGSGNGTRADSLVRAVRDARDGSRNATLYWAARRAHEEGHGGFVIEQLETAAMAAGLSVQEIRRALASARTAHFESGTR